ncbi:NfeD family protein [Verrucomicrobiota bacterium]
MGPTAFYFILVIAGVLLISAETIVPGGILGIFGSAALITAAVVGWMKFSEPYNYISIVGVLILSFAMIILWLRILPKTGISLSKDASDFKAPKGKTEVAVGTICETLSPLRPSGMAMLDGKRIDVITEGNWIDAHVQVKVIRTEGCRIFVRECND